jgi:hypothetical protein
MSGNGLAGGVTPIPWVRVGQVAAAVVIGGLGGMALTRVGGGEPLAAEQAPRLEQARAPQPTVPVLAGLTAADARRALVEAGLTLEEIVPAEGEPGRVVGSEPGPDQPVAPGTAVTMFVGVEPQRFREEIGTSG